MPFNTQYSKRNPGLIVCLSFTPPMPRSFRFLGMETKQCISFYHGTRICNGTWQVFKRTSPTNLKKKCGWCVPWIIKVFFRLSSLAAEGNKQLRNSWFGSKVVRSHRYSQDLYMAAFNDLRIQTRIIPVSTGIFWPFRGPKQCGESLLVSFELRFTPEGMRNSVMLNVLVVMVGLTFFAGALDALWPVVGELVGHAWVQNSDEMSPDLQPKRRRRVTHQIRKWQQHHILDRQRPLLDDKISEARNGRSKNWCQGKPMKIFFFPVHFP